MSLPENIYYKIIDPAGVSLGLNRCPIVRYRVGRWVHPLEPVEEGTGPGGLWVAKKRGGALWMIQYCWRNYRRRVAVHLCMGGEVLYQHPKTGRTKLSKLFLLDEVKIPA